MSSVTKGRGTDRENGEVEEETVMGRARACWGKLASGLSQQQSSFSHSGGCNSGK